LAAPNNPFPAARYFAPGCHAHPVRLPYASALWVNTSLLHLHCSRFCCILRILSVQ
jgi:hypothetical protein